MEEEEEDDEQEEDTLFDKRRDAMKGLKSALKASRGAAKGRSEQRVEVVGASRGGLGACGRWMVTFTLCASFLGLVNSLLSAKVTPSQENNDVLCGVNK